MPSTPKQRPPLVIVLAVLVPLVAIGVAAVIRTGSSDGRAGGATTLVQDGAPGADPATSGSDPETTTVEGGAGGSAGATTTTRGGTDAGDGDEGEPSPPGVAGGEDGGDARTTVTYPQPTIPPAGCARPSGTAVITLDEVPDPPCLELGADQPVVFRNRTGKDISVVAIGLNEVVAAGSDARVGAARDAFGDGRSTFWSPGNPQLSGIVEVG